MDSKERIDQLTDQLKEAGYRYYVLDDPTMEDYEYNGFLHRNRPGPFPRKADLP